MNKIKLGYIFRIDDVVPWMNWDNFNKIEKIFDKYWMKPIIWVVPNNQDFSIWNDNYTQEFWNKIKKLHDKWWTVAQHWYHHKYVNKNWWILNINHYWEFAWLTHEKQFEMIKKWKDILEKNLWFKIKWWMAPAHSFDRTTCKILNELKFEYITDWLALYPFTKYWLKWVPQQIWKPMNKKFGIWTICLHINEYDERFIQRIEEFCKDNQNLILNEFKNLSFDQTNYEKFVSFLWKIKNFIIQKWYKIFIKIKWVKW